MTLTTQERWIVDQALTITNRAMMHGARLECPESVKQYLRLHLFDVEHEVFGCIWLTTDHSVIKHEELFSGTIDAASVYPREVVKAALACNAGAAIIYHNHPSGCEEPSQADRTLTARLKEALGMMDVRLLDHFVVGREVASFAERGWL